jgi:hypothetical protein
MLTPVNRSAKPPPPDSPPYTSEATCPCNYSQPRLTTSRLSPVSRRGGSTVYQDNLVLLVHCFYDSVVLLPFQAFGWGCWRPFCTHYFRYPHPVPAGIAPQRQHEICSDPPTNATCHNPRTWNSCHANAQPSEPSKSQHTTSRDWLTPYNNVDACS